MPYTRRQVRYLLSNGSPLSDQQKDKMKDELHQDPALGHAKKKPAKERHTHMYNWRNRHGLTKVR